MRIHWSLGISAVLICAVGAASAAHKSPPKMKAKPASSAKQVADGKAMITKYSCNGCHSADLKGKPGFSPSLHWSSLSKEYDAKSFAVVMDTGMDPHGHLVKKPMPVYHLKPAQSAALLAYLKTQK
ncbi:MAG: cytochrome c [Capsulimonas sp.]|uniref:c-type cytochrome n=1 Tax=Capsulimonas sp. TaxID=2494211 RepID=UPI003262F47D